MRRLFPKSTKTYAKKELTLCGEPCVVSYKNTRNVYARVKSAQGPVEISAPVGTSDLFLKTFIAQRLAWIQAQRETLATKPSSHAESASKKEIEQWRKAIKSAAPPLVDKWAKIMNVHPKELAYRNMSSMWGNCRPQTGRICLNIRLALYPPECLEYVVVHELCHLLEPSHNARFHSLMDRYLPDWRKRKSLLK